TSLSQMTKMRRDLFHSIRRLDVLQDLIETEGITEVMINGADRIFVEKDGEVFPVRDSFSSPEKLDDVIQQVVSDCNRIVNESSPIVDCRLQDGSRVNVVLPPVALDGPVVTIRRFPKEPVMMEDLIANGSVSEDAVAFLGRLVAAGYNIFISGGTGSGKTTFLNALSEFIPKSERIITIEDNAELQIRHIPNLVRMEARNANTEGCGEIPIRELIRTSLRMRPDRIIVGEVRGAEALDMLQAMNTGHDGSMSTGHANSARDMLARLETMVLMGMELPVSAIRSQIAQGIDILVHLGRLRDRTRKLLEISEILGMNGNEIETRVICRFEEEGEENGRIQGRWIFENGLEHTAKLAMAGILEGPWQ
ncbi:MAG: CpaF family protein, partial [Lachnospiraceae bacterium]|nr:CpaF family protein [Lachnospiraceae bacterium]